MISKKIIIRLMLVSWVVSKAIIINDIELSIENDQKKQRVILYGDIHIGGNQAEAESQLQYLDSLFKKNKSLIESRFILFEGQAQKHRDLLDQWLAILEKPLETHGDFLAVFEKFTKINPDSFKNINIREGNKLPLLQTIGILIILDKFLNKEDLKIQKNTSFFKSFPLTMQTLFVIKSLFSKKQKHYKKECRKNFSQI